MHCPLRCLKQVSGRAMLLVDGGLCRRLRIDHWKERFGRFAILQERWLDQTSNIDRSIICREESV